MCFFFLPESNSFPGPRQLHINWPKKWCQGYSVQVLWCCHCQLNTNLEVRSLSCCLTISLSLCLFLSHAPTPYLTSVFCCFVPVFPIHVVLVLCTSSSLFSPSHIDSSWKICLIFHILLMFPLSVFSLPSVGLSFPLSVRSILSGGLTASRS